MRSFVIVVVVAWLFSNINEQYCHMLIDRKPAAALREAHVEDLFSTIIYNPQKMSPDRAAPHSPLPTKGLTGHILIKVLDTYLVDN